MSTAGERMIDFVSPRLQFTRDGKQLAVAHADRVGLIGRAGERVIAIEGVESVAAFSDQVWTQTAAGLARWGFDGRALGASVSFDRSVALVPTLAGPPVASCGARLWIGEAATVRELSLDEGALPFCGRKLVSVTRERGMRVVRLGTTTWRLPIGTQLIGAAPLFDGTAVALFVRTGEVNEAWSSTLNGEIRQRITFPDGELRLAARRGLAIVRTAPDSFVAIDLRYGQCLGMGAIDGDDFAIDPDGKTIAAMVAGEIQTMTLEESLAVATNRRNDMDEEECNEQQQEAEEERDRAAIEGVISLASGGKVPGAEQAGGVMGMFNGAMDGKKGIDEIADGDVANGGIDVARGAAGVVGGGAELLGNEGVGRGAKAVSAGLEISKGAGEIATDEGYGGQTCNGIHDILMGVGDGADAVGGNAGPLAWLGAAGKGLSAGMKIGDWLAPKVFGDMNEHGSKNEEIPEDGFHASTGNGVIDWIAGVGDYTNGRF